MRGPQGEVVPSSKDLIFYYDKTIWREWRRDIIFKSYIDVCVDICVRVAPRPPHWVVVLFSPQKKGLVTCPHSDPWGTSLDSWLQTVPSWTSSCDCWISHGGKTKEAMQNFLPESECFEAKVEIQGFTGFQGKPSTDASLIDPMPNGGLLSRRHSQHSCLVIASGGQEQSGGGRVGSKPPILDCLALSPLSWGLWPLGSAVLTKVILPYRGRAPSAICQLKSLMKLGQAEPGGSSGRAGPPAGRDVIGSREPPLRCGPGEAPLDNVFQVFNLKTKKLFSVGLRMKSPG